MALITPLLCWCSHLCTRCTMVVCTVLVLALLSVQATKCGSVPTPPPANAFISGRAAGWRDNASLVPCPPPQQLSGSGSGCEDCLAHWAPCHEAQGPPCCARTHCRLDYVDLSERREFRCRCLEELDLVDGACVPPQLEHVILFAEVAAGALLAGCLLALAAYLWRHLSDPSSSRERQASQSSTTGLAGAGDTSVVHVVHHMAARTPSEHQARLEAQDAARRSSAHSFEDARRLSLHNLDSSRRTSVHNLDSSRRTSVHNLDSSCRTSVHNLDSSRRTSVHNLDSSCRTSVHNWDSSRRTSVHNFDLSRRSSVNRFEVSRRLSNHFEDARRLSVHEFNVSRRLSVLEVEQEESGLSPQDARRMSGFSIAEEQGGGGGLLAGQDQPPSYEDAVRMMMGSLTAALPAYQPHRVAVLPEYLQHQGSALPEHQPDHQDGGGPSGSHNGASFSSLPAAKESQAPSQGPPRAHHVEPA